MSGYARGSVTFLDDAPAATTAASAPTDQLQANPPPTYPPKPLHELAWYTQAHAALEEVAAHLRGAGGPTLATQIGDDAQDRATLSVYIRDQYGCWDCIVQITTY